MILKEELGRKIGDLIRNGYRLTLLNNRKYATKKTYESIEYEVEVNENEVIVRTYANVSLLFIEFGRRKGAKLPVQKTANGFELVFELQEWVEAVGFTGSHFLLARSISKKGIKGVPITDLMLQEFGGMIDNIVLDYLELAMKDFITREMDSIFSGLKS